MIITFTSEYLGRVQMTIAKQNLQRFYIKTPILCATKTLCGTRAFLVNWTPAPSKFSYHYHNLNFRPVRMSGNHLKQMLIKGNVENSFYYKFTPVISESRLNII